MKKGCLKLFIWAGVIGVVVIALVIFGLSGQAGKEQATASRASTDRTERLERESAERAAAPPLEEKLTELHPLAVDVGSVLGQPVVRAGEVFGQPLSHNENRFEYGKAGWLLTLVEEGGVIAKAIVTVPEQARHQITDEIAIKYRFGMADSDWRVRNTRSPQGQIDVYSATGPVGECLIYATPDFGKKGYLMLNFRAPGVPR